jgi:DinB superfamily
MNMDGEQTRLQDYRQAVSDIERMPQIIQELLAGLDEDILRARPPDGTWSIIEHICHLRDIEQEGYRIRITKMLTEDHPFLTDLDGDKLAEERGYINQDFKSALKDFVETRAVNASAIHNLSPDQLSKEAMFENVGRLNFRELLIKMREHDHGHINDLTRLRDRFRA